MVPFANPNKLSIIEILRTRVSVFNKAAEVGGIMKKVLYGPTIVLPYS